MNERPKGRKNSRQPSAYRRLSAGEELLQVQSVMWVAVRLAPVDALVEAAVVVGEALEGSAICSSFSQDPHRNGRIATRRWKKTRNEFM